MKENKDTGLLVFVNPEKGKDALEDALRRFKKRLDKFGTLDEYKTRQTYLKPSERKRLKRKNAKQKNYRD